VSDSRIKPMNLQRHKNSEYDFFLLKHATGAPNCVPAPFPINEQGRLKKTQVLDHIIKMKT